MHAVDEGRPGLNNARCFGGAPASGAVRRAPRRTFDSTTERSQGIVSIDWARFENRHCQVFLSFFNEDSMLRRMPCVAIRLSVTAMVLAVSLNSGEQSAPKLPVVSGVPRADQNSRIAHEQLLNKARTGRIDIYFEGDSITRRWGCSDAQYRDLLANWKTNFFGWNAADFGWGGDRVQNILWRLETGELDGVSPRIIVLLAGTNNLRDTTSTADQDALVTEITDGIRSILNVMQQKAPKATILLTGITPRKDRQGGTTLMPSINAINNRLAMLADGRRIRFFNINHQLAGADGKLFDGMTVDGLHLSVKGYQVWADALKPVFIELLGPPASVDHAPPPTGDPGARSAP